jgi:hypothetical protein
MDTDCAAADRTRPARLSRAVGTWPRQTLVATLRSLPVAGSAGWRRPDEGPGLTWRQLDARHWSGTWNTKIRGTVTADSEGWLAYVRLEDPPGLSPITTVGRYATVEEAQVATDEVWACR